MKMDLPLPGYITPPVLTHQVDEDCARFLRQHGKAHTLTHSLAVRDTCAKLARRFGLDENTAKTAAMLHDISSVMKPDDMTAHALACGWQLDAAEKRYPFLLHQRISAVFAAQLFGVQDPTVLSMVGCHSTLRSNPSEYDMLLFLADKLSWDQAGTPPFLPVVMRALNRSLAHASLVYIRFVMEHGMILLPHQWLLDAKSFLESHG